MIARIALALAVLLLIAGGWVIWVCDRELIRRAALIDAQDAELTRVTAERNALAVKVHHLAGRNADLRAELDRLTATAALSDEPPARCRWSAQTLADIHALPTTSPEDTR
ncbi:hypothetical protein ACQSSU_06755 [Micromonospora echinospora]